MRECRKIPPLFPSESRSISGRRLPHSTPSCHSGRKKNIKSAVIVANAESSVVDPDSLNPDPNPAFQVNPDPFPRVLMTKN